MKQINNYIIEKLKINKETGKSYTCHPKDKEELITILKERLEEDKDADLNDIDVSQITDMNAVFCYLDPHNIKIDKWDVSNVKDMICMFFECSNFNCDLSKWDVSNVKDMVCMFFECSNFNCDLSKWDVSKVTDMSWMFDGCSSLKNKPNWYKR